MRLGATKHDRLGCRLHVAWLRRPARGGGARRCGLPDALARRRWPLGVKLGVELGLVGLVLRQRTDSAVGARLVRMRVRAGVKVVVRVEVRVRVRARVEVRSRVRVRVRAGGARQT